MQTGISLKRSRIEKSKYRSTEHVSSTSEVCERIFSVAELVMSDLRKHMDSRSCTHSNILLESGQRTVGWYHTTIIDGSITDFVAADEPDE